MILWKKVKRPVIPIREHELDWIAHKVAGKHGVTTLDILGTSQKNKHVDARQELARKLHFDHGMDYCDIGEYLNKERTTIWYYINKRAYR